MMGNGKTNQAINNSLHSNSIQRTNSDSTLIESEDSYNATSNPVGFSTGNLSDFLDSNENKKISSFNDARKLDKFLKQRITTSIYT